MRFLQPDSKPVPLLNNSIGFLSLLKALIPEPSSYRFSRTTLVTQVVQLLRPLVPPLAARTFISSTSPALPWQRTPLTGFSRNLAWTGTLRLRTLHRPHKMARGSPTKVLGTPKRGIGSLAVSTTPSVFPPPAMSHRHPAQFLSQL